MTEKADERHGSRHLRVRIEIGSASPQVTSIWVVDHPVIQESHLIGPVVARIDIGGRAVLVQAFADPRIIRGVFKPRVGHSFGVDDTGIVEVSVPFTDLRELADVRIRLVDTSAADARVSEPGELAALIHDPPASVRSLGEVTTKSFQRHREWPRVASALGLTAEVGRFEVYRDRAGQYRWRLKRHDGQILADGVQAYTSREACEDDLLWLRSHAASLPIVALDVTDEGTC